MDVRKEAEARFFLEEAKKNEGDFFLEEARKVKIILRIGLIHMIMTSLDTRTLENLTL